MMAGVLRVVGAECHLGGTEILTGVTLDVAVGEIVGLVGPNGSGKSTLLTTVIGARSGGRVELFVDDVPLGQALVKRARTIAFVEQQAPQIELTVHDVVALGRTPYRRRFGGLTPDDEARVDHALHQTGCHRLRRRSYATLSGGERQRVLLARALAQDTPFLLLDEPTNHLDLAAQSDVLTLLTQVAATGVGILMAIHDLSHAATLCDKVVVLRRGAVVAHGVPKQVLTTRLIHDVFGVDTEWLRGAECEALAIVTRHERRKATSQSRRRLESACDQFVVNTGDP